MKTIMVKCSLLLCTILSCTACTQNDFTDTDTVLSSQELDSSKAIFSDTDDFIKSYHELCQMTVEEQDQWIKNKGFTSVLALEQTTLPGAIEGPRAFKAIFNKDLIFQIGDSIIWYDKGNLFIASTNGNTKFDKTKDSYPLFAQSDYKNIDSESINTRFDHGANFRGNHILQYIQYGNYEYRYISELSGHSIKYRNGITVTVDAGLFLSLRLDYRGLPKGKWANNSHTERDFYFDLNGVAYFTNGAHTVEFLGGEFRSFIKDFKQQTGSGTIEMPLIRVISSAPTVVNYSDRWYIQGIKGSIYQQLSGITSTRQSLPLYPVSNIW